MAVTGQIGDAEVRLDNAAEEATMQKILTAINSQNSGGAAAAAGGAAGSVAGSMVNLGKSVNVANLAFSALGKTLGLLSGAIKGVTGVAAGAVDLGTGFAAAQPKVTDFTKSLSNLPWILGDFGSAIHSVTDLLYKNYTTFQQLSTSGIAFGDQIERMNSFAASVGVGLDTVAGNLASSSEQLARLGTGTRGARMAVEGMAQAFDMNSSSLMAYGLSFEEINETYMSFFARNSLMLQRGTMTQEQLNSMSGDYARGLRRLSELTGVQADQIQAEIDKANMNRAFENFISNMDAAGKQRMESIISTFGTGFGDAGREAAMAAVMGIAPVTEGAQNIMAMNGQFNQTLSNVVGQARNFQGTLGDFNQSLFGQMNQFARANRQYADTNSRLFATLDMMGDPYGAAGGQLVAGINMFSGSIEDIESSLGRESPMARTFRSFNEAVQKVREGFTDLLVKVFDSTEFKNAMDTLAEKMPQLANAVTSFLGDLATPEGRQKRLDQIFDALNRGFQAIMLRLNDSIFDWFIDDDKLVADQTEQLAGSSRTDLEGIAQNANEPSARRQAAQNLLTGMNEASRGSIMDQYNPVVNQMIRDAGQYGLNMTGSRIPLGQINSYNDDDYAELNRLSDGQITNRDQLEAWINEANRWLKYRTSVPGSQYYTGSTEGLRNMANDLGLEFRTGGTTGMTGHFVEPKNTIAHLEKGEKVIPADEVPGYRNAMAGGSGAGLDRLGNKLVDSNREHSVKLIQAVNMLIDKTNRNNTELKGIKAAIEHYG